MLCWPRQASPCARFQQCSRLRGQHTWCCTLCFRARKRCVCTPGLVIPLPAALHQQRLLQQCVSVCVLEDVGAHTACAGVHCGSYPKPPRQAVGVACTPYIRLLCGNRMMTVNACVSLNVSLEFCQQAWMTGACIPGVASCVLVLLLCRVCSAWLLLHVPAYVCVLSTLWCLLMCVWRMQMVVCCVTLCVCRCAGCVPVHRVDVQYSGLVLLQLAAGSI